MGPPQVDGGFDPLALVSLWAGYRVSRKINNASLTIKLFDEIKNMNSMYNFLKVEMKSEDYGSKINFSGVQNEKKI
jgi:hypothetical protein